MKYLVTGGAGFIGNHVARSLLDNGHEVVVIDNVNDYYDPRLKEHRLSLIKQAKLYRVDVSDQEAVSKIFSNERFDKVIHLAAQAGVRYSLTNPFSYVKSNVQGTLSIFEACRHHDVRDVVYASSSSVYGGNKKVPFSEKDPVEKPISLYAQTKRDNELMAHTYNHLYGLNLTGLRFFTVYGPMGRPDMAGWIFARKIMKGEPIEVFNHGKMRRDFTFVSDIARGVILASERTKGCEVINLGNHKPVELDHFISLIEKNLGKKAERKNLPMQPGDVPETWADISKAEELLGWKPTVSIEDGMASFITWFKDNPELTLK